MNKQKEKREKYSRRRRHDPDADIDYINERNMKFNQKLERFVIRLVVVGLDIGRKAEEIRCLETKI